MPTTAIPSISSSRRRLPLGVAALAVAALALAGCSTPAHDKDTNFSKYNYSYNK